MPNYFKLREMRCKDRKRTQYPKKWRKTRWKKLQTLLNKIRAEWGAPIRVTSGYRTPAYNRKVKGARRSQHVQGRAADLHPKGGATMTLHGLILQMYRDGDLPELKGLGAYAGRWVHVDCRPGKRLRRWKG